MKESTDPFSTPISDGLIRILLKIQSIECKVENDAPDFVDVREDSPKLMVSPEADVSEITDAFLKNYPLVLNERNSEDDIIAWEMADEGIWFDIEMNKVKDIWLSDFSFQIQSERPRYLAYYIQNLEHRIEWLQKDDKTGEIRSLSEFKKKFRPSPISETENYSGSDVLKCADMLGRAIRRIDLRTGGAMIKFNTEKGRLEPLIRGLAEKLGYEIKSLSKETIHKKEEAGERVSHIISLK